MSSAENVNAAEKEEEKIPQTPETAVEEEKKPSEESSEAQETEMEDPQITELKEKLSKAQKEADDYLDKLRRNAAEFDNYRKRTEKEKENERVNGVLSVLNIVLPMVDNLERGLASIPENEKESGTAKGLQMVYQQVAEGLKNMGVTEIPSQGEQFDPNKHNAVMHIEDEKVDENTIVEVFQKGYEFKGRVVRYSMVKVAN